jgi:hypothetical protein
MLKLADVLAIDGPERDRLIEADDAIRDLARAIEAGSEREGADREALAGALVGVLMVAAARQARSAYPSASRATLSEALAELAEEAVDWTFRRGVKPKSRGPQ